MFVRTNLKCYKGLFGQLPEQLKHSRTGSISTRKRQATSPHPGAKVIQSSPDVVNSRLNGLDENTSMRRASTFPMNSNSPHRQRSSIAYENAVLAHHMPANLDSPYTSSNGTYTPTTSETLGVHTPDSNSGANFNSGPIQQSFDYQHGLDSASLPDLTAMMFPSGDPFAYPNQPMITLEDRQLIKPEPAFGSSSTSANMFSLNSNANGAAPYDLSSSSGSDPQLYGSIPLFMMTGQETPCGLGMQTINPSSQSGADLGMMAMKGGRLTGWSQHTARTGTTPGINLDDLFGEGWKGTWMDQEFGQC